MHDIALISADQTWLLLAILLTAAAVGLWADRQRWGSRISGAVVSILITFVLTNTGIVPVAAPLYDQVWGIAVPLAIPLLLLRADLRRIASEAGPMLLAFLIGAIGTVAGVLLMRHVLDLGTLDAQLSAVFAATYIGGSMNFAATAQAVELTDGAVLSAAVAADNLLMTGGQDSLQDMIAGTERGLLLTTLWYMREVDPAVLLLTGLTRDGVYLVEDGEVTAAVNNFRFNESPLDLLRRATQAGVSELTLPREWGDWATRAQMPSLRIPDFHMSSVSQAQ